jgi:hypothetical protein
MLPLRRLLRHKVCALTGPTTTVDISSRPCLPRLLPAGAVAEISFDGEQLFVTEDDTFPAPGKVALWTKADSVTHFDKIAITPLD